ncbi:hypothetical protein AMST5_00064 [freshwater sediment metagenome]|uniref:Single-stranded DNA-binding protein n=1 Tax=freshwater sediment metagenome TaxID=556182 RepID=A0AA48R9P0_9ZZZZ
MSVHALVSGVLYRAPERRMSKAGKPFVTATIQVRDGDGFQWWKACAFSESTCEELMRLGAGDAVAVQGTMRAETYQKNGEIRVGYSITAMQVTALRAARKAKDSGQRAPATKPAGEPQRHLAQERHPMDRYSGGHGGADGLDDDIPF